MIRIKMDKMGKCSLCGAETSHRCANCQDAFYCCRDHQKKDWKNHKVICRPFTVQECPEVGKHLLASRAITVGNPVMTDSPIVVGPAYDNIPVCLGCYRKIDGSHKCPKCNFPLCEKKCEDQADHQAECGIVQKYKLNIKVENFEEPNPIYQPIMILRCLALKWKKDPWKWNTLMEMESHLEERRNTAVFQHETEKIIPIIRNEYKMTEFTDDDIHTICAIIDINALEIRLMDCEIMSLYPTAYMMQHSCVPNTKQTFDAGGRLLVKASIPINIGDTITTFHTNSLWSTHARRDHLKCFKYFSCMCERCKDPTEFGTEFGTLICPQKYKDIYTLSEALWYYVYPNDVKGGEECKGLVRSTDPLNDNSDWKCEKCQAIMPASQMGATNVEIGERVDHVQANLPFSIEEYEILLTDLQKIAHTNHYQLFPIKHSLLQMYGRDGTPLQELNKDKLDRKTQLCNEILGVIEKLDPTNARLTIYRAVSLLELHLTLLEQAQRLITDSVDRPAAEKYATDAGTALTKAKTILENVPEGAAEAQIQEVVEENSQSYEKWLKLM